MARRIVNTTYKVIDGFSYRLEIWDNTIVAQGAFVPFSNMEIADPGFVIDWKGSVDDVLQSIMSSSMKFSAYLTETQRDNITVPCFADEEFSMFVRLYRQTSTQDTLEWAGIIHPEETTERVGDGYILTTFTASDGLAALKNIDFKETNGDLYSGEQNLTYWLQEVIRKVPHWSVIDDYLKGGQSDGSHDHPQLTEHRLVRPVNDTYNTFPSNDAVLNHYWLRAESFYIRPKPSKARGGEFERKRATRRNGFVSTYEVLQDICSSLGATFCFSEGRFHIFDRERIINGDDDTIGYFNWQLNADGSQSHSVLFNSNGTDEDSDLQVTYLDHIGANFLEGVARAGVYAIESFAQTQEGAGSDLVFRSGIGYDGPELETYLHRVDHFTGNTEELNAITFSNSYSNVPADGIIDDISLPNGDTGGKFRLHFSGDTTYESSGSGFENHNIGNIAVLRMDLRVYDGTYWFRLRRRVRTLQYISDGSTIQMDVPNTTGDYLPKTYEQYSWVRDDESNYDKAFLEIMIGSDPSILTDENAGETEEILQNWDFSYVFHSPPLTKQDGDNSDALVQDSSRNHFIYRFDEEVLMPTLAQGATGTFTKIQIQPNLRLYEVAHNYPWQILLNSSGQPIDVGGETIFQASSWPLVTKSSSSATDGNYSESDSVIRSFQLSGIELYLGDGTENYDAKYVSHSQVAYGSEQERIRPTSFGASYENSGNRTFGRYRATHPSDSSLSREDNLKFHPDGFTTSEMSYANMYTSLGLYTTGRALNIRGKNRQSVSGTIIRGRLDSSVQFSDVCRPYKKFKTSNLSTGEEFFLPHSLTLQIKNHAQKVEALRCGYSSELVIEQEQDDTGRNPNRPPGSGNGGFTPGGGVNHIFQKNNELESQVTTNISNISSNTTDISDIETDLTNITNVLKTTFSNDGAGVYANSSKSTTASHMSLTTTTAKVQAGGGNTAITLSESSPGNIDMDVQVGPSGSEVSRTAIQLQGTTGSQLPNIIVSGNLSGVDIGDLDDVTTNGVQNDQVLAWNGTNFVPVDQTGGSGVSDTTEIELKTIFLEQ